MCYHKARTTGRVLSHLIRARPRTSYGCGAFSLGSSIAQVFFWNNSKSEAFSVNLTGRAGLNAG